MKINSFIHYFLSIVIILFSLGLPVSLKAERGYTERDYINDRHQRFQGFTPVLNGSFTISQYDPMWDQSFGYVMSKDKSLLLQVQPVKSPAGVIMFASNAGSPRNLKAVWAHDHITEPIRFWTHQYWTSDRKCNATGCPRIMFKATRGTLDVIVIDRKR